MPPKRKAASTKAVKDAKAEDVAAENGAAGDASKSKKGKAAKEVAPEEPKPRRGRAAKTVVEEDEDEEPAPKEAKGKGRKPKTTEDEPVEQEPRPKRGRAAKEKPDEKPKTKSKTAEPKKKAVAKPKKGKAVAKSDSDDEVADEEKPSTKPALQNETVTDYSKIDFSCTRANKNGQTFNYKIASWNVDGLRAAVKKGAHHYIINEDPDIMCLQEIKCTEEQLPDEIKNLELYTAYWCSSEKDGYAGVGLLTKVEPISVEFGIGVDEHDEEGRCITAEYENFYLINVYVPNAGRKLVTLPKRMEWNAAFQEYVKKLDEKKPVIVCGDMNVSHQEIDLANPKSNKKNAGFTEEERNGMSEFLGDGYVDTYRNIYPDKAGVYTYWTYMMKCRSKNVGWRLDYFIVSQRLVDDVCDNVVRSEVFGSDHCPIILFLNVAN